MAASGEKSRGRRAGEKREPRAPNEDQTQNDVVLRFMIFFFLKRHLQNDVVLGF